MKSFLDACSDRRMSVLLGMSSVFVEKTGMTILLPAWVTAVNSIFPKLFLPFPVDSADGGSFAKSCSSGSIRWLAMAGDRVSMRLATSEETQFTLDIVSTAARALPTPGISTGMLLSTS